jgi:hypothetical protein
MTSHPIGAVRYGVSRLTVEAGAELDRKMAALLEHLGIGVPDGLAAD